MLKLSRNNQNIKMFGVPPNTLPLVIYIWIFLFIGYYYITTCHSKQLPVGLMVLSDGMVHFLKIKKIFTNLYPNYLVVLISLLPLAIQKQVSFYIQSTLPKSNSHKSNNRLSRRSIQVLFSLYAIVFNPS